MFGPVKLPTKPVRAATKRSVPKGGSGDGGDGRFTRKSRGAMPRMVLVPIIVVIRNGRLLKRYCPRKPPQKAPKEPPMLRAVRMAVLSCTLSRISWERKSLRKVKIMPHGKHPMAPWAKTRRLVRTCQTVSDLCQLMRSLYRKLVVGSSNLDRSASSVQPRAGSGRRKKARTARKMEGSDTMAKGIRQPWSGPTMPLTNCPKEIPSPMDVERIEEIMARRSMPKMSPSMEKISGIAPPIAIPVRARRKTKCQYFVTSRVARHGASPRKTTAQKRELRCTLSVIYPIRTDTGAPTRKKTIATSPPSFLSRSSGVKPKSSAIAVRFGAMTFWSANKNAVMTQSSATDNHLLYPSSRCSWTSSV
mmetsp:Transcript_53443/g.126420  ORF Transcript_53443/g.126420 Transcript_53443/m.126420 type:complete len:361 (-) Transcript_53443:186-1268(-)